MNHTWAFQITAAERREDQPSFWGGLFLATGVLHPTAFSENPGMLSGGAAGAECSLLRVLEGVLAPRRRASHGAKTRTACGMSVFVWRFPETRILLGGVCLSLLLSEPYSCPNQMHALMWHC